jgi:hypothetical protein
MMRLFGCRGTDTPWEHDRVSTYILQDAPGVYRFVEAETGRPHPLPWDSERIRRALLDSSYELPVAQWPVWMDPDLVMDEGL